MSGRAGGRFTVGRLMLAIAAVAALLAAGMYRWQNLDVERATISANLAALRRGDNAARLGAARDLSRIRPTNAAPVEAALAEALAGDGDAAVREAAAHSLGWVVGQDRPGQPSKLPVEPTDAELASTRALLRALSDPDARVRAASIQGIGSAQAAGRVTLPIALAIAARLSQLLDDPDAEIRRGAILALAWSGSPPMEARDRALALALMEHDPEIKVRNAAVRALVVGWPAPELYPLLLARYAATPAEAERGWIIQTLAMSNVPPPAESIPPLVELMATDPTAARWVPGTLAKLGKGASPWLGAVGRVAEQELADPQVGYLPAVYALIRIDPTSAEARAVVGPLARRFRDARDDSERVQYTNLVDRFGLAAAPAIPILREALHSPVAGTRADAARLLGNLGPAAGPAIADLEALSRQDPDPPVRASAEKALAGLRQAAMSPPSAP